MLCLAQRREIFNNFPRERNAARGYYVGLDEYIQKIEKGWVDVDVIITMPAVMAKVGRLGRILGPRNLMPNPKSGTVTVDGTVYELGNQDCLYVGMGSQDVRFGSLNAANPAKFYLLSAPAHAVHPTTRRTQAEATPVQLGAAETANVRTIYKYIYAEGIQSCQLVMGLTQLAPGNVWNTMPSHTHDRRMEAYLYFNLPEGQRVLHLLGEPTETRPLWVSNEQAILSPPWSIHTGCGSAAYAFIWGMAGENREYTDMDAVPLEALR